MICASRRKARNWLALNASRSRPSKRMRPESGSISRNTSLAHGGFAASGFADQRQRLAGIDAKTHAIDGLDEGGRPSEHRTSGDEMFYQIFDLEQGGHFLRSQKRKLSCPGRCAACNDALQNRDPARMSTGVDPGSAPHHCAALVLRRARGTNGESEAVMIPASPAAP